MQLSQVAALQPMERKAFVPKHRAPLERNGAWNPRRREKESPLPPWRTLALEEVAKPPASRVAERALLVEETRRLPRNRVQRAPRQQLLLQAQLLTRLLVKVSKISTSSVANIKTLKGGPLGKKFEKKSHSDEKTERGTL